MKTPSLTSPYKATECVSQLGLYTMIAGNLCYTPERSTERNWGHKAAASWSLLSACLWGEDPPLPHCAPS